jgi:hypothetical protein
MQDLLQTRVARFFLARDSKTVKMYQMNTKFTLNSRKISPMSLKYYKLPKQHFPIKSPQKFTQIGIFGLKINHLATLLKTRKHSITSSFFVLHKTTSKRAFEVRANLIAFKLNI